MSQQVDLASRPLHSSAFAAFHAQRLHELRGGVEHLCTQAWDVNAVWRLQHDVRALAEQMERHEPQADASALWALHEGLMAALALETMPGGGICRGILTLFRAADTATEAEQGIAAGPVHQQNDRAEVPPPGFWRRWVADAALPQEAGNDADRLAAPVRETAAGPMPGPAGGLDFSDVDIDAMIASGQFESPSLEIVQERVAPHIQGAAEPVADSGAGRVETPYKATFDPPADASLQGKVSSTLADYDWDLETPVTAPVALERSLDGFWGATGTAGSTPSAKVVPGTPAKPTAPTASAVPAAPAAKTPAPAAAPTKPAAPATPATPPVPPAPAAKAPAPAVAPAAPKVAPPAQPPRQVPVQAPVQTPAQTQIPAAAAPAAKAPAQTPAKPAAVQVPVPPAPAPVSTTQPATPPALAASSAPAPTPALASTSAPQAAGSALRPMFVSGAGKRIYHLTESSAIACVLDQRLEQLGYELELLESVDELKEMLGALTPNLVIVDTEYQSALEHIGTLMRTARLRASAPIPLLVLGEEDTMYARLSARRAGADAMLFGLQHADEAIARIEQILHAKPEEKFRVLIVEDDRAQGLFAQSILRSADMEAEVVEDGLKVMEAMQRFRPDLVLMDLYMPDCNGSELTALIREHDEFLHTPIVFLSGESDEDKHLEALSAGGDEFLAKPIRPRHLITTVSNRARRARIVRQRSAQMLRPEAFDRSTGLHFRTAMLERLEQTLLESDAQVRPGGVLLISIDNIPALRQRLGLITAEELLDDVAQFIVSHLGRGAVACRYGDACFMVFDALAEPAQLRENAQRLRDVIAFNAFETPKGSINLEVSVGVTDLRQPFADAAAVLSAAESASPNWQKPVQVPVVHAPETLDPAKVMHTLTQLAEAVGNNRLDLDYQPIAMLQGSDQAQYQTLLRLRQPDGNDLTAGDILPLLRSQGRLPEFDRWVMARALEVILTRLAMARPVTLFVNQSVETLCQPGYADWLVQRLQAPAHIGESLVLEIDIDEIGLHLDTLQTLYGQLVKQGARFCLARYRGSEAQDGILNVLPVDMVKVAPDVVAALDSPERRAEFGALVEFSHERQISVIAPRVEDPHTAAVLWMSGIDYIQGNLVQLAGQSLDFDFNAAVL